MRVRFGATIAVACALVFALEVGPVSAKSDKETCKSTTADVDKTNADGNQCESEVSGSGPNKATATASEKSRASAEAEDGANATADASMGGFAVANVVSGEGKAIALKGGADVEISNGGQATARATGSLGSAALAQIEGTGGIADATADGNGYADSTIESGGGGTAISIAKQAGTSWAFVGDSESGMAKAISSGRATAQAVVSGNCYVTANASGNVDDSAVGACQNSGSVVTVEATGGAFAQGSDTTPPVCRTPLKGGKAKVRSPGGDCLKISPDQ
jgi:hypothetical protein